jgi:hypothetical protein
VRLRKRVYEILTVTRYGDTASRVFDTAILTLIGLNVIALNLGTVQNIRQRSPRFFLGFEIFSVVVFTLGKIMAAVMAILGIGMFALPTGILGAGFVEQLERRPRYKNCPQCGAPLENPDAPDET